MSQPTRQKRTRGVAASGTTRPVQIYKNGKPAAVIVYAEDYASTEELKLQFYS